MRPLSAALSRSGFLSSQPAYGLLVSAAVLEMVLNFSPRAWTGGGADNTHRRGWEPHIPRPGFLGIWGNFLIATGTNLRGSNLWRRADNNCEHGNPGIMETVTKLRHVLCGAFSPGSDIAVVSTWSLIRIALWSNKFSSEFREKNMTFQN